MVVTHFAVTGLTCATCLAELLERVRSLDAVDQAAADLTVGGATRLVLVSENGVDVVAVRSAVESAGFALTVGTTLSAPHVGSAHLLAATIGSGRDARTNQWTSPEP